MFATLWESARSSLAHNQFLSGGLVVGLLGTIIAFVRSWPKHAWGYLIWRYTRSVLIPSTANFTDKSLLFWLANRPKKSFRNTLELLWDFNANSPIDKPGDSMRFCATYGTTWIWHERRLFSISYQRQQLGLVVVVDLVVRCFSPDVQRIKNLLCDAIVAYNAMKVDNVSVMHIVNKSHWSTCATLTQLDDGVILDSDQWNSLYDDMRLFSEPSRREWYIDRRIPHRRGYLFHGLPGTGKTSAVRSLAIRLHRDLYCLNLHNCGLSANALQEFLRITSRDSIILLEDVDRCSRNVTNKTKTSDLVEADTSDFTMTDVLNILDGVTNSNGRIVVMTTNNIDQLDPALIRPGRIDRIIEFGPATLYQSETIFLRFFPGAVDAAKRFARNIEQSTETRTLAQLQEYLIENAEDIDAAVRGIVAIEPTDRVPSSLVGLRDEEHGTPCFANGSTRH